MTDTKISTERLGRMLDDARLKFNKADGIVECKYWQDRIDAFTELLASRHQEPVNEPIVKPLEWLDADEGFCTKYRAAALGGAYELVNFGKDDPGFAVNFHWGRPLSYWFIQGEPDEYGPTGPKVFPTLEEAKEAAQADYEQRVRSALEPASLHKGEAVMWHTIDIRGRLAEATDAPSVAQAWREQGYTVRPLYASPVPLPVTITPDMVDRSGKALVKEIRNQDPEWAEDYDEGEYLIVSPSGDYFAINVAARACLTAALSTGEQG